MNPTVIVDANALVAIADRSSKQHEKCLEAFAEAADIVIPALCVAEATYLIERDLGPPAEMAFLRGLRDLEVWSPEGRDWERIADVVLEYEDFQLGGTDASIVVLAEHLDTDLILTLDHRHFRAIKPRHCEFFRLLPEV